MTRIFGLIFGGFNPDNLKSKIQNLKWNRGDDPWNRKR